MAIFGFVNVKRLLLELAQHQSVDTVLRHAVDTMASASGVAMVRVWLMDTGDMCESCKFAPQCRDKTKCLHLKASAGRSLVNAFEWTNTTGAFSRFPVGIRKVGKIAQEGKPVEVLDVDPKAAWIADGDWIAREQIRSFVGQPLIIRDEVLGVLSVFTRDRLEQRGLDMLRMIADHLAYAVANARAFEMVEFLKDQVEQENFYLKEEIREAKAFDGIIGRSSGIEHIREMIRMVGPTEANVLIYGESGTGKEMITREIHNHSERSEKPLIKINCSAIPQELFESEFFGHTRGAFTGAIKNRIGYFQAADGGTLFLDEIGEIPIHLQSKLLRVLQEGEYQRVGEDHVRKVDVRIISATNRNLRQEILTGNFREDLYYRLQVFPMVVPPLRERKSDIPLLADHFMRMSARRLKRPFVRLKDVHMQSLVAHDWPGNIRELQNIIERIVITSQPDKLIAEIQAAPSDAARFTDLPGQEPKITRVLSENEMCSLEKANMEEALRQTGGRIYGRNGAATLLGIKPTTLVSRLKKIGITYDGN
jgi:transcriptional regulator with GAF, ATPase, and Fis domain